MKSPDLLSFTVLRHVRVLDEDFYKLVGAYIDRQQANISKLHARARPHQTGICLYNTVHGAVCTGKGVGDRRSLSLPVHVGARVSAAIPRVVRVLQLVSLVERSFSRYVLSIDL